VDPDPGGLKHVDPVAPDQDPYPDPEHWLKGVVSYEYLFIKDCNILSKQYITEFCEN
jgi:hypothetical protein